LRKASLKFSDEIREESREMTGFTETNSVSLESMTGNSNSSLESSDDEKDDRGKGRKNKP